MKDRYPNIIGGKYNDMGGYFPYNSPFFPSYAIQVADANPFAVAAAKSAANAVHDARLMKREDRTRIVHGASDYILFERDEIEHVARVTGMAVKHVEDYMNQIPMMLREIPRALEERLKIYESNHNGGNTHSTRQPVNGYAYVVTPANDPRASALIISILASMGIPLILKASAADMPVATKVVEALHRSGYPPSAINLICYNTKGGNAARNNFSLVDGSGIVWPFGSNDTVDNLLRFEPVGDNGEYRVDHFSGKIVLRHGSGNSSVVVDTPYKLSYGQTIGKDAFGWYIGCNKANSGFAVGDSHRRLMRHLADIASELVVGNPLDPATDIGYTDSKLVDRLCARIDELGRSGLLQVVYGGERKGEQQITPMVAETNDPLSEGFRNEISAPTFIAMRTDSFRDAVEKLKSSTDGRRLSVAIHSDKYLDTNDIPAYHVRVNDSTMEVEPLDHEGHDYASELTRPQTITETGRGRIGTHILPKLLHLSKTH